MSEYLSPGVYVEEVSSGNKPIEGVGTSTGAFVGIAERGPVNKATLISNWTQFVNNFGGFVNGAFLAYGVYSFFNEGGTKCYVTRVDNDSKTASETIAFTTGSSTVSFGVQANSPGTWGNSLRLSVTKQKNSDDEFNFVVERGNSKDEYSVVESFPFLKEDSAEKIRNLLKASSYLVTADPAQAKGKGATPPTPVNIYGATDPVKNVNLSGGTTEAVPSTGLSTFFIGDEASAKGLNSFNIIDDVNILAIPDAKGDIDTMKAGMNYCANRKDCFFIIDSISGKSPTDILKDKKTNYQLSYGALYYPWIKMSDPLGGTITLPPSGAVAGIYSRTDVNRGVHKAPAGVSDGYIRSAIDLEKVLTKGEQDTLNNPGVNVIRFFPGSGICVWGARTTSTDAEWKYVNIRRLFLFLEESIDEASQWVVFEPNSPELWGKVKRNLTAFLTRVWRDGALFGTTADEAFFVKIDEENNPQEVRDAGQLIIEVGVAPVKPAEFVIIRISQRTQSK